VSDLVAELAGLALEHRRQDGEGDQREDDEREDVLGEPARRVGGAGGRVARRRAPGCAVGVLSRSRHRPPPSPRSPSEWPTLAVAGAPSVPSGRVPFGTAEVPAWCGRG